MQNQSKAISANCQITLNFINKISFHISKKQNNFTSLQWSTADEYISWWNSKHDLRKMYLRIT